MKAWRSPRTAPERLQRGRDPDDGRRGRRRARQARGDGGRDRRRADGGLLRIGRSLGRADGAGPAPRLPPAQDLPGPVRLGHAARGRARASMRWWTSLPPPRARGRRRRDRRRRQRGAAPVAASAPVSAFVFKTIADPFAGRLSLFRVMSGTLKRRHAGGQRQSRVSERLGTVSMLQGKQLAPSRSSAPGTSAWWPLKETKTGDTLSDPGQPIRYPEISFPAPAISFALEPKTKGDEEKISTARPPHGRGPCPQGGARPADPRAARLRQRPGPRRGGRGQDEEEVRRRRSSSSPRSPT